MSTKVHPYDTNAILDIIHRAADQWMSLFLKTNVLFLHDGIFPKLEVYELEGEELGGMFLSFVNEKILPNYLILDTAVYNGLYHYYLSHR